MTNSTTNTTIRMDSKLNAQTNELFSKPDMNLSTTFSVFIYQSPPEGKMPFEISLNKPNKETIAAILDAERLSNDSSIKGYSDIDELFNGLKKEGVE